MLATKIREGLELEPSEVEMLCNILEQGVWVCDIDTRYGNDITLHATRPEAHDHAISELRSMGITEEGYTHPDQAVYVTIGAHDIIRS